MEVKVSAGLPSGWTPASATPALTVSSNGQSTAMVRAIAPAQLNGSFAEIKIRAESQGKMLFQDSVFVQVSAYVAGQVK